MLENVVEVECPVGVFEGDGVSNDPRGHAFVATALNEIAVQAESLARGPNQNRCPPQYPPLMGRGRVGGPRIHEHLVVQKAEVPPERDEVVAGEQTHGTLELRYDVISRLDHGAGALNTPEEAGSEKRGLGQGADLQEGGQISAGF